ncbi:hypothetical protein Tco_1367248 [Tanacetum coccineum]
MASVIVSSVVSCYGKVILNLLRDDEGDGDGNDGVEDGDGDLYLLRGGAVISYAIVASIDGARVYGGHTVFLGVHMRRLPHRRVLYG